MDQRNAPRRVRQAAELLLFSLSRANQQSGRTLLAGMTAPEIYDAMVAIVLRLAFLFAAERLKLLPIRNRFFDQHYSVLHLAAHLGKAADQQGEASLERSHAAWNRLVRSFRVIFSGLRHPRLKLPAIGGYLFHPGRCPFLKRWLVNDYILMRVFNALDIADASVPDMAVIQNIGRAYEQLLDYTVVNSRGSYLIAANSGRRKTGTHYTPRFLTQLLVESALEPLVYVRPRKGLPRERWKTRPAKELLRLKICDPACGAGAFLLEACCYLADRLTDHHPEKESGRRIRARRLVARRCLYGVDKDPLAVELTKLSLRLLTMAKGNPGTFLDHAVRCGDSLVGMTEQKRREEPLDGQCSFHWPIVLPEVFRTQGGFDAILGNPPWGQKAIADSPSLRRVIRRDFVSCAGIHDLFRPFVERGIRLLADNGVFGMVLPDILLLKNYPDTRKFLLDNLALQRIDWWGRAFAGAVIDAITLVGIRTAPAANHKVQVWIHERGAETHRWIPQADFWKNPKYAFNLHLTPAARQAVNALQKLPTLGNYFEIHEGVHSGNLRTELFVDQPLDHTCREMYFGRDEIRPYLLHWRGKHIRLSALPETKTRARYANAGQAHWYAQPKVLVRRTGDFVLAAVDVSGRYASNNFFVVFPKNPCPLNLFGLCALLNSDFMTWFFRTIEPRQGRVFAELKIKHLKRFPLPLQISSPRGCDTLNALGSRRARLAVSRPDEARREIDTLSEDHVRQLYGNVHPTCD